MAATSQTIVYVACAETCEILRCRLDRDSGALDRIDCIRIPGFDRASPTSIPLALSPDRRRLYAAMRQEPYPVATFSIDPGTGGLTHLDSATLPHSMPHLSVDPTGRHLLAASVPGNLISSSPIDPDGVLRRPAAQVIGDMGFAHCILLDPSGRHVYVAIRDSADVASIKHDPQTHQSVWPAGTRGAVARLDFDPATGLMSAPMRIPTPPGGGPRHMRFAFGGRFLYLLNELDATILLCAVDAESGMLTQIQHEPTQPAGFDAMAADLQLTPDQRFLYASERNGDTISAFRVDPVTARLSPIGAVPTESRTRSLAIDPRGQFLLAAGQNSNHVSVFAIDQASGSLRHIARYATPANPSWIEILDL